MKEDVSDVVQNVFLALAKGIHRFDSGKRQEGAFRSWLWAVTNSKLADFYQNRRADQGVGGSSAVARLNQIQCPIAGTNDSAFGEVVGYDGQRSDVAGAHQRMQHLEAQPTTATDLSELMQRAMKQVEPEVHVQTWKAFYRTVIDEQSTASVAQELSMKPASVRQARSRVLRRLRQQLGDID